MLSKKDIVVLRGMFGEFEEKFDQKLGKQLKIQESRFDQKLDDQRRDLRDEIHSCISASEKRMVRNIEERLNEVKTEIIDGITDILDEFVLPPIAELKSDMTRVKDHLQMA